MFQWSFRVVLEFRKKPGLPTNPHFCAFHLSFLVCTLVKLGMQTIVKKSWLTKTREQWTKNVAEKLRAGHKKRSPISLFQEFGFGRSQWQRNFHREFNDSLLEALKRKPRERLTSGRSRPGLWQILAIGSLTRVSAASKRDRSHCVASSRYVGMSDKKPNEMYQCRQAVKWDQIVKV